MTGAPQILALAHVLVGEPDPTSSGHAVSRIEEC
jgi:hypothetical protein